MISFLIAVVKIIILLGFLILIHEAGHFVVAKLCKVKVNEFAIGFGPAIWKKQGKETSYEIKAIPMGGFVNMLGEEEPVEDERAYNKKSIPKKICILLAGGAVNIIFGLIVCAIVASSILGIKNGILFTGEFLKVTFQGIGQLFTGQIGTEQLVGVVGISDMVVETQGLMDFAYMLAVISVSLGVTNLLPFPPLDGGKILLLLIEAIRRKPLKQNTEIGIQMAGFFLLIGLSIFVTYNDIARIF